MAKWIYNNDSQTNTYSGQQILTGAYYEIEPEQALRYANDDNLLADIGSLKAIMSKSGDASGQISGISGQINFLKDDLAKLVDVDHSPAFASKKLIVNGVEKSLFKRVHGASLNILAGATGNIDIISHYMTAKFTGAEIFGTALGDTLNFFVLDDASNTYSGAPGSYYQLNQFGFDVQMPPDRYQNTSNYDADIFMNMVIRCQYTNNGASAKDVAMNLWLHEVK